MRPVRGALHGHPVVVDRSLFDLLRSADPTVGAKPIVRAHASSIGDLAVEDDGAFLDVDTPDDYARVSETFGRFELSPSRSERPAPLVRIVVGRSPVS